MQDKHFNKNFNFNTFPSINIFKKKAYLKYLCKILGYVLQSTVYEYSLRCSTLKAGFQTFQIGTCSSVEFVSFRVL